MVDQCGIIYRAVSLNGVTVMLKRPRHSFERLVRSFQSLSPLRFLVAANAKPSCLLNDVNSITGFG